MKSRFALVFAAAHANYPGFPAYSRLVELFGPALIWGLIFLRFGLLPTVILHALFDLTLMSIPVFLVQGPGADFNRALVIAAGLVPTAAHPESVPGRDTNISGFSAARISISAIALSRCRFMARWAASGPSPSRIPISTPRWSNGAMLSTARPSTCMRPTASGSCVQTRLSTSGTARRMRWATG